MESIQRGIALETPRRERGWGSPNRALVQRGDAVSEDEEGFFSSALKMNKF
jgi:hypothetical protein